MSNKIHFFHQRQMHVHSNLGSAVHIIRTTRFIVTAFHQFIQLNITPVLIL